MADIRTTTLGGVPFGTSSQRPSNPQVGQIYNNGELGYQEIYTNSGWIPASGGNDFNLNITGTYTAVTFSQSYASGSYSIVSSGNDTAIDIYSYAADGSVAGYTSTKAFTATQRFNKMVVIGGTTGDVLSFSYKTTFATSATTSEVTAGPFITSVSPSSMPNINDTVTITGGNFAENVQVEFTGTGYSSVSAKSIVRSSSSQLIVTRPDNFPISSSPYTITITNPGVSAPAASLAHISSNSITAGTNPAWSTSTPLPSFAKNVAYSQTLLATDTEGSDIDYSIVSGSLPAGLSLNEETGVISGTPTVSTSASFTIRATDAGGNFLDRAFTMPNAAPVWSTASGALTNSNLGSAYSFTLVATDDSGVAPSYSLASGSLPTGLSLSSSGVISGTPTVGSNGTASSFTARATDANGSYTDRAFSIYVLSQINTRYTSSGSWTVPSGVTTASFVLVSGGGGGGYYPGDNVGSGGGGAGGILHYQNQSVTPGSVFNFTVGAGASQGTNSSAVASAGGTTSCTGFVSPTGGGGGSGGGAGGSGGSGGGGRSGSGGGTPGGQGNNGGSSSDQDAGGGGGGHSAVGGTTTGIQSAMAGDGGAGSTFYGFTVGGGGGGGHSNRAGYPSTRGGAGVGGTGGGGGGGAVSFNGGAGVNGTANTGGGGGGSGQASSGGTGGSGCVIISYLG